MKGLMILEYIGVGLAAIGFGLLSMGLLLPGFITGLISCGCLITYFFLHPFNMRGLFSLQVYFFIANIIGIVNNIG